MRRRAHILVAVVMVAFIGGSCVPETTNQLPVAVASADPSTGIAPLTVEFSSAGSNDPDGLITAFLWNFGDGDTSQDANPTHVYADPGTYVASLKVTDNSGGTRTTTVTVEVTGPGNQAPTAVIAADPTTGTAPLSVDFDGSGSTDPESGPLTYLWDFGDGGSSTDAVVTHEYTDPGNYTVTLTVTDDQLADGSATTTISVGAPPNLPPVAAAQADATSGNVPLVVNFTSTGSDDLDGTIENFAWTFGDGNVGSGPAPTHTYTVPGDYTATLTVTDDDGETDTATVDITAKGALAAPTSGGPGTLIVVTMYCTADDGHPDLATAIAALVTDPGGSVVVASSTDNSGNTGNAVVTLTVPPGTPPGSYKVTTSCDTYFGSVQYPAIPFTVT